MINLLTLEKCQIVIYDNQSGSWWLQITAGLWSGTASLASKIIMIECSFYKDVGTASDNCFIFMIYDGVNIGILYVRQHHFISLN